MGYCRMDRVIIGLNENWRFHYGDVPEAWYKGFDDRDWEQVFLPHDWSVHYPFKQEYSSGTGYLAGGIGWYRVRFSLPEEYRGKSVSIVFDGIYKNSRIWCNSYHLGKRPYGYSEISYDITDFVNFGEKDNEISVQVTHTDIADSRWFTGSGIYRKAYLIVEEAVHPTVHGTYMKTVSVENGAAFVEVGTELVNTQDKTCWMNVCYRLIDRDGNTAAVWKKGARIGAGKTQEVKLAGKVENPVLWSTEQPYLYTLVTQLSWAGGRVWQAQTDRVGIRTIAFDPDRGFYLNGRETKLKGVCVHHDGGCLGAAMYKEVWLRRLLKLKEAGCNAIRTSHNPHMPELYDLCDELGFLMMDEAFDEWENPKNKWSTGHNVYPPKHQGYAEDFPQWHEADLTAMIKRDRNHPSIIMWSIGNEIDYPNDPYCHPYFETMTGNNDANKPAAERMYNPDKPNAERLSVLAAHLAGIVKSLDDSRPVTLAAAFPELSSRIGFFDKLDVVGYNYKEHLYEQDHKRFPDKPFLGSENSHSYEAWRAVTDHPYISGQFLWTGIDYLGEARGWPVHGSYAGILDLAGNEKPGFYRRKAFWSKTPYACLLTSADDGTEGEWKPCEVTWNYEPGTKVLVRCFTSLDSAQLYLNGRSAGNGRYREKWGCFEWSIDWEPGILEAVCRSVGKKETSCRLETTGKADHITAEIWKAPSFAETSVSPAAPASIVQIEAELLDAQGRPVTDDDADIYVEVKNGVLLGLESGDLADVTSYTEHHRKTFRGRMVIYVRPGKDGQISVSISCERLEEKREILL